MKNPPAIKFSPQQLAFFDWVSNGTGSCVLEAVAGAGKTSTLVAAVKLMKGTKFFGAFNKKIADEIGEKTGLQMGLTVSTMHAAGMRVWKKVADKYVKVESGKVRDIFRAEVGRINPNDHIFEGPVVQLVGLAKQSGVGIVCDIQDDHVWHDIIDHYSVEVFDEKTGIDNRATILKIAKHIFSVSLNTCTRVIDFDDMIFAPLYFNVEFDKFDWVVIDEAQDTNVVRRLMALRMMKVMTGRMAAVGDRHQAIYGFTGADDKALDLIAEETKAIRLPLTFSFRCPKSVVAYAKQWVNHIESVSTAPEGVVRHVDDITKLSEEAQVGNVILCRFNAPLIKYVYSFISKGIPARVEGREIGEGIRSLANRFSVKTMDQLIEKLGKFHEREQKKLEEKENHKGLEALNDKVECLRVIIARVLAKGTVTQPPQIAINLEIDAIFGNQKDKEKQKAEDEKPHVLLSSIHKSKGREWKKVIWLTTGPSPFAKQDWEMQQEDNLCYVATTRSMSELVMIPVPKEEKKSKSQ